MEQVQQVPPPEVRHAKEPTRLAKEKGSWPPGWLLTPQAMVALVYGNDRLKISRKLVGDVSLAERCVITLASEWVLLPAGEPGMAKSILSELLSVTIYGASGLTVQGSAGAVEDQFCYGWNYAQLLTRGPSEDALVGLLMLAAIRTGRVAWVEEITRCLPEAQDALVSALLERRLVVPELGEYAVHAVPGFCVIMTANLRDRGVSEMSAVLKRRLNFGAVEPIAGAGAEIALVMERTRQALAVAGAGFKVDGAVVETLAMASRELRSRISQEGWAVEKSSTVLPTAEAVAVSGPIALAGAFFPHVRDGVCLIPGQPLSAVYKDDSEDDAHLLAYWDSVMKRRAVDGRHTWVQLWEQRYVLEA